MKGKLLIIAAPSGAGKTTIARHLLRTMPKLAFSVSATTRAKRTNEQEGYDYYYISPDEFRKRIHAGAFLEWEEVYQNQYYGTLHAELRRLWAEGRTIVFDVDVKGAVNIQKAYPEQSLSVFIKPPSIEALRSRLEARGTETAETINKRIARAAEELSYEPYFDCVIVNDNLDRAIAKAEGIVTNFLS